MTTPTPETPTPKPDLRQFVPSGEIVRATFLIDYTQFVMIGQVYAVEALERQGRHVHRHGPLQQRNPDFGKDVRAKHEWVAIEGTTPEDLTK